MRSVLVFAVLAVAVPDREDPTPKPKPKSFQEQILGAWSVDKVAISGAGIDRVEEDAEKRTLHITMNQIMVKVNGEPRDMDSAGYTLDVSKMPIAIDITPKNDGGMKMEGILKLEGDRLTLCFSIGGPRPTEFNTTSKSIQAIMHLKRIP